MSDITLYNLLKRIPDATNDEVEKAIAGVASSKEVATKSDIKEIKIELKYLRWFFLFGFSVLLVAIKFL